MEELVDLCMGTFRDLSLETSDMVDQAREQIGAYTDLEGAALDRKTLDVCLKCRDLVHEEQLAATRAALAARIEALRTPVQRSPGEGRGNEGPAEVKPPSPVPSSAPARTGPAQLNPAANPWQPSTQPIMPSTPSSFSGHNAPLPPRPMLVTSALTARLGYHDIQRANLKKQMDDIKEELRILQIIYDKEWDSIDSYESRTRGGQEREDTLCRVYQARDRIKQLNETVKEYTKLYVKLGQGKEEVLAEIAALQSSAAARRGASTSGSSIQPARGRSNSSYARGESTSRPARRRRPRVSRRGGTTYYS